MEIQSKTGAYRAINSAASVATSIRIDPGDHNRVGDEGNPKRRVTGLLRISRSSWYITAILGVALSTCLYHLRIHGLFGCQASRYDFDRYLSYCNTTGYGDYDHGAIWFGLEKAAVNAAASAHVLFLGNSRTQFAFSSHATADWFSSLAETYYLLGFSHEENYTFEAPLLLKLHPRAKVYVINIDTFFDQAETGPGRTVMQSESAQPNYETKRHWQYIQKPICSALPHVCGTGEAIFRSRSTGAWVVIGNPLPSAPVSYNERIDTSKLASYTVLGREFLHSITPDPACIILTVVPTVNTPIATGRAVAAALGFDLVAPVPGGLVTFDRMHLDLDSAQRWSSEFFANAGPRIRACLG